MLGKKLKQNKKKTSEAPKGSVKYAYFLAT